MPTIPAIQFRTLFDQAANAATSHDKGRAFEDLICELFSCVPGIEIAERNTLNVFGAEEVDVALWNEKASNGFYFLPHLVLVECKNWDNPVGAQEVAYFVARLQQRGCDHGFLVAANGITGDPGNLTRAHFELATALARGIRVIVLTRDEIEQTLHTDDLVKLIKKKLCQLTVSGTVFV